MLRAAGLIFALTSLLLIALPGASLRAEGQSEAADQDGAVPRAAAPPWVDTLPDVFALSGIASGADPGLRYLLRDQQFAWPEGVREIWERQVVEITTPEDAAAMAMQVYEYNAALEAFLIGGVSVWRDGEEMVLTSASDLRTELFGVESDAVSATRQAYAMVTIGDLRPGDLLDISVLRRSVSGQPTLEREAVAPLEFPDPVTLARVVVNWPEGWELYHPPVPEAVTLASGPMRDGGTRYEYQLFDQQPEPPEVLVPAWVDERAVLRLRADQDWQAITAALGAYYAADWPLGPWEARAEALRNSPPGPASDAVSGGAVHGPDVIAALQMIRQEITGSDDPWSAGPRLVRSPAEVVRTGSGSPTEKALLLAVMLRRMGLEADLALTSDIYGRALDRLPPSLAFFDKALVRLQMEGRTWWLDPSQVSPQGRLETLTPQDHRFALILRPGITAPEAIPVDPAAIRASDIHETWRFTPAGVFLDVVSDYRGTLADDLRYRFAAWGIGDISEERYAYYQNIFPQIVMIRDPDLTDDMASGAVLLHERYFLPAEVIRREGVLAAFPMASEDFVSELPVGDTPGPTGGGRKWPMAGMSAGHFHYSAEIFGRFGDLVPPAPVRLENPAFRYRLQGHAPAPGRLVLEWDFFSSGADIAPAAVAAVLRDAQKVYDTTWFEYNLED